MKRTTIIEAIIFLYVILFVYTGISKIWDHDVFIESIENSPILKPIARPISWGVPLLEIVFTLMLAIPRWRLKGLYGAMTMMILFTLYITAILLFRVQSLLYGIV